MPRSLLFAVQVDEMKQNLDMLQQKMQGSVLEGKQREERMSRLLREVNALQKAKAEADHTLQNQKNSFTAAKTELEKQLNTLKEQLASSNKERRDTVNKLQYQVNEMGDKAKMNETNLARMNEKCQVLQTREAKLQVRGRGMQEFCPL